MKIEMGESLIASYFKHVKGCLIVQTNWKISGKWKASADGKEKSQNLYKKIQSDDVFADIIKTGFEQTLKQAEIDVVGIDVNNTVYMAEVAFHENGLQYGDKRDTKDRVCKKLLRAYLAGLYLFPNHKYEIIFASPKVNPATDTIIREFLGTLNNRYSSEIVKFHYYNDENFRDEILIPTYKSAIIEADTSELFIRSAKMLDMFDLLQKQSSNERPRLESKSSTYGNSPDIVYRVDGKKVDGESFRRYLLKKKIATRIWVYADGTIKEESWDASKFSETSSLSGNIHSTQRYRIWRESGLVKLILDISGNI